MALNLVYDDTTAEIQDGVTWSGSGANDPTSLTVEATAHHTLSTIAKNGAKAGDVGIGGAVAVVVSKNHTNARVGTGAGDVDTAGAASITSNHTNTLTTDVGSAATGSDAAIGASVGVVIVEDTSSADVARGLNASGNVAIHSQVEMTSNLNVQASAGGGDSSGSSSPTSKAAPHWLTNMPGRGRRRGRGTMPFYGRRLSTNQGYVFQIIGDAFCAAFHTAGDALRAAINSQVNLNNEVWKYSPIAVRMGIHTGTAHPGNMDDRSGGYSGYIAMVLVQRVMSIAHGGQILISNPSAELLHNELPGDQFAGYGQTPPEGISQPRAGLAGECTRPAS